MVVSLRRFLFGNRFAPFSIGHCSFGIFGRVNISTFVSIAQTIHPNGKGIASFCGNGFQTIGSACTGINHFGRVLVFVCQIFMAFV